VGLKMNDGTGN